MQKHTEIDAKIKTGVLQFKKFQTYS